MLQSNSHLKLQRCFTVQTFVFCYFSGSTAAEMNLLFYRQNFHCCHIMPMALRDTTVMIVKVFALVAQQHIILLAGQYSLNENSKITKQSQLKFSGTSINSIYANY